MSKLKVILSAIAILQSISVLSQKFSESYENLNNYELNLQSYEKAPNTDAIVLFDKGDIKFVEDVSGKLVVRLKKTKRIKILKENGIEFATVNINLYSPKKGDAEYVTKIKGQSIYLNPETGRVEKVDLKKENIYEKDYEDSDSYRVKSFTIPQAKVGSIIQYEYIMESPYVTTLNWNFQSKIPTVLSLIDLHIIPYYTYAFIGQGFNQFDIEDKSISSFKVNLIGNSFKEVNYTYGMRNTPAFENEKYITSKNDYIQRLKLQLAEINYPDGRIKKYMTSWDKLSKEMENSERFGKFLKKTSKFSKNIFKTHPELIGVDEIETIRNLNNYVKSTFAFNEKISKFSDKTFKDFIKDKSGNSAAINLLYISLLQAYGIDAKPVLSSTRDHGKINPRYPFISDFDYVLVFVEGSNNFILDATDKMLPFDMVPAYAINGIGLVQQGEARFVKLEDYHQSLDAHKIILMPDVEGGYTKERIKSIFSGYKAYSFRNYFQNESQDEIESILSNAFNKEVMENLKLENLKNIDQYLSIGYESESYLENAGEIFILDPFGALQEKGNFLSEKERNYPVDFNYLKGSVFSSTVIIPPGFEIDNKMKNTSFESELVKYSYTITQNPKQCKIDFKYEFKKSIYLSEDYKDLKMHYDRIIELANSKLILKQSRKTEISK